MRIEPGQHGFEYEYEHKQEQKHEYEQEPAAHAPTLVSSSTR